MKSLSKIKIDNYKGKVIEVPELGKKLPRVTTILDQMDKPALVQWASNMAADYAREVIEDIKNGKIKFEDVLSMDTRDFVTKAKMAHKEKSSEAKTIGKRVHDVAEKIFKDMIALKAEGEGKELQIDVEVDDDIKNPVNALLEFIQKHHLDPMAVEEVVLSESFGGYIGRLDLICYVDDKLLVIDTKTSKAIYDGYAQQVAAYDHAFSEMSKGFESDGAAILRLDKETGYPAFHLFTKEQMADYLKEFGLWCQIWHMKNDRKKREKEEWEAKKKRVKELKKKIVKVPTSLPDKDPF